MLILNCKIGTKINKKQSDLLKHYFHKTRVFVNKQNTSKKFDKLV